MKSEILDEKPSENQEAELKLIAAVVQRGESLFDDLMQKVPLRPEEFRSPVNALIWSIFIELAEKRTPFDDDVIIREALARKLKSVDIAETIQKGSEILGSALHAPFYASQIRECYQRRQIRYAAERMFQESSREDVKPEQILANCEAMLTELATGRFSHEPVDFSVSVMAAIDEINSIITEKRHMGTMTGFWNFDSQVGGLFCGELSILAARPGIGKTSLALQWGFHAASRGRRVYFASLEMSHVELAIKMLCSISGVSNQNVRNGDLDMLAREAIVDASEKAANVTMKIHDWSSIRVYDIRRAARAMKADLIIIDYLQLVTPSDQKTKRYEQVAQLAKDLKALARELNVPVLALAQLNRDVEQKGKDNRPRLSQLRESGDIEQTADMVMLLSRPRKRYEKDGEKWDAELDVAKNRKGAKPLLRLDWDESRTVYRDYKDSF